MKSTSFGRVAALSLVVGLLGLAGCNRPAGDSPMGSSNSSNSSNSSDASRPNSSMPDSAASAPMSSASSPITRP